MREGRAREEEYDKLAGFLRSGRNRIDTDARFLCIFCSLLTFFLTMAHLYFLSWNVSLLYFLFASLVFSFINVYILLLLFLPSSLLLSINIPFLERLSLPSPFPCFLFNHLSKRVSFFFLPLVSPSCYSCGLPRTPTISLYPLHSSFFFFFSRL